MKVVEMEHNIGVKGDATIQHSIGEKVSLSKKTESGIKSTARSVGHDLKTGAANTIAAGQSAKATAAKIAANPVVKAGGKVVSMTALAVDKAVGNVDIGVVQLAHKSLHIASGAVRLGGKTVKVAVTSPVKAVKLTKTIAQKIKLLKQRKHRLKVKTSGLFKAMRAAYITKKYVVKPAFKLTKSGVKKGGAIADTVIQNIGGDDTVRFAKSAYNITSTATKVGAKTTVKGVKTTGKIGRTLLTKRGRRGLVTNVQRRLKNIITAPGRAARNVKNAVNNTVRAAKFAARLAANIAKLAAQAVAKLAQLIASTAPWSLIAIGIFVLMLIIPSVFTALVADDDADNNAGLVSADGDNAELLENMGKLDTLFAEAVAENITEPLKNTVTSFCGETDDPQNIIVFNGTTYYPASGKGTTINSSIEAYVTGSLSSDRFASMLAALKVFRLRETGERPEESETSESSDESEMGEYPKMFTKDDFKTFIGTVNGNTCGYGVTFFIKTTSSVGGQTCPGSNCKERTCNPGCKTRTVNGKKELYCPGHKYCDHDHTKMTVTLKTVEEYYTGKGIPEIYNFDEEEIVLYDKYKEYLDSVIEDAKDPFTPSPNSLPDGSTSVDYDTSYEPADFSVSSSNTALLILLVIGIIAFGIRKRGG